MNQELFQKILDVIDTEPEVLHMTSWEDAYSDGSCGTTRCIWGHAIAITTGEAVFDGDALSAATRALAKRVLGEEVDGLLVYAASRVIEPLGLKLLGLEAEDLELAYSAREDAEEFVRLAAAGDFEAARRVLDED